MVARNFAAYRDCRIILDTAIANDQWPVEYTLKDEGEAVQWRLRANRLRSEIRKYDKRLNAKPIGESPYDELVFLLDGPRVIIDKRTPTGVLTHAGKTIDPIISPEPDDEDDFTLEGDL